jgi:hypothetical protein
MTIEKNPTTTLRMKHSLAFYNSTDGGSWAINGTLRLLTVRGPIMFENKKQSTLFYCVLQAHVDPAAGR